jgi:dTMP kinase
MLASWNAAATGGLVPDLTLLFDVDPALGLSRRSSDVAQTNRLDREPPDFHQRVRRHYLALAAADPVRWIRVDASRPPDEIAQTVWAAVDSRLPARTSL